MSKILNINKPEEYDDRSGDAKSLDRGELDVAAGSGEKREPFGPAASASFDIILYPNGHSAYSHGKPGDTYAHCLFPRLFSARVHPDNRETRACASLRFRHGRCVRSTFHRKYNAHWRYAWYACHHSRLVETGIMSCTPEEKR